MATYRAVLTRHASDADFDQTVAGAPRMTVVARDYDSIGLAFSRPVCGSPETGCAALTADHFEVCIMREMYQVLNRQLC